MTEQMAARTIHGRFEARAPSKIYKKTCQRHGCLKTKKAVKRATSAACDL